MSTPLVTSLQTAISNINTALKNLALVVAGKASIDDASSSTTKAYSSAKVEERLTAEVASLNTAIESMSQIDDAAASTTKVYSSSKTESIVTTAVTALSDTVTAQIASLNTAIGAEATARTDADTALQTSITDLNSTLLAKIAAIINDTQQATDTTYSSDKIVALIAAAKAAVKEEIVGTASAAYDTLKELQTELEADDTQIANILTLIGNLNTSLAKAFSNLGAIADSTALDAAVSVGFGYLSAAVTFGTTGIAAVGSVQVLPYTEGGLVYQTVTTPTAVLVRQQTAIGPVWGDWMIVGGTAAVMQTYLNLGDTSFDFGAYWDSLG